MQRTDNSCTLYVLRVYSARTASVLSMYFACTRWADLQYIFRMYSVRTPLRTLRVLWGGLGHGDGGGCSIVLWRVLLVYCECTLIEVRSTVLWHVLYTYCVMYSIMYSVLQNAPCTLNVLSWAV